MYNNSVKLPRMFVVLGTEYSVCRKNATSSPARPGRSQRLELCTSSNLCSILCLVTGTNNGGGRYG